MKSFARFTLAVVFVSGLAATAEASTLTIDLNCILTTSECNPSGSFGTIVISDSHPSLVPGAGDLYVTVDLVGSGEKFRDLMLNYTGTAARITNGDATNMLSPDSFNLPPYTGNLDIGRSGGQGWSSATEPYSAILYGWTAAGSTNPADTSGSSNVGLTLADFQALDTLNNIYAAIHIQALDCQASPCPLGITNGSSIKVGGTFSDDIVEVHTPEPASLMLLSSGMAFMANRVRRRRRTSAKS